MRTMNNTIGGKMPNKNENIWNAGSKAFSIMAGIVTIAITLGVNVYQTRSNASEIDVLKSKVNEGELTRAVLRTELNYLKEYMSGEMDEIKMLFKEQRKNE